jgi:hypothetical protein
VSPQRSRQGPCALHPALTARLCVALAVVVRSWGHGHAAKGGRLPQRPFRLGDADLATASVQHLAVLYARVHDDGDAAQGQHCGHSDGAERSSAAALTAAGSQALGSHELGEDALVEAQAAIAAVGEQRVGPSRRRSSALCAPASRSSRQGLPLGSSTSACARPRSARNPSACTSTAPEASRIPGTSRRTPHTRRAAARVGCHACSPHAHAAPGRRVRRRGRALGLEQRAAGRPRHAALGADEALVAGRSGDTPRPQAVERARDERRVAHGCGCGSRAGSCAATGPVATAPDGRRSRRGSSATVAGGARTDRSPDAPRANSAGRLLGHGHRGQPCAPRSLVRAGTPVSADRWHPVEGAQSHTPISRSAAPRSSHAVGRHPGLRQPRSINNSRGCRASPRSVVARFTWPRRAPVSAGSARRTSAPTARSSSATNRQPVVASSATSSRRPPNRFKNLRSRQVGGSGGSVRRHRTAVTSRCRSR